MRLLLALLLLVPAAAAQTTPDAGSLAAYQASRLYIEGTETVTANATGQILNTSRTWQALQGDSRISEAEFYEIVGRDDLLAVAQRQDQTRTYLIGGGAALTAAGSVLTLVGGAQYLQTPDYDDPDYSSDQQGLGSLLVGASILTVGALVMQQGVNLGKRRATHVQAAAEMAAVYNAQLEQEPAEPETIMRDTRP